MVAAFAHRAFLATFLPAIRPAIPRGIPVLVAPATAFDPHDPGIPAGRRR
jgi:hypothetical protein